MKKICYLGIAATLIFTLTIDASSKGKSGPGIGIIVGEPTGISFKYNNFPILGVAWSVENHLHVHCDYWIHSAALKGPVDWYVGVGGKVRVFTDDSKDKDRKNDGSDIGLGVRVPLGLQYFIINELELFGEIVPGISLYPATGFDIDLGIGLRYYF